jgi:hypothetical protein
LVVDDEENFGEPIDLDAFMREDEIDDLGFGDDGNDDDDDGADDADDPDEDDTEEEEEDEDEFENAMNAFYPEEGDSPGEGNGLGAFGDVEVVYPRRSYIGARNVETVKDCELISLPTCLGLVTFGLGEGVGVYRRVGADMGG